MVLLTIIGFTADMISIGQFVTPFWNVPTPAFPPPPEYIAEQDNETLVLVADFLNPQQQDPNRLTQTLVNQMRTTVASHKEIRIERLNWFIPEEGGSKVANELASHPNYNASIVIWGDYTLEPEPELYLHFDLVKNKVPFLGGSFTEQYGPHQIRRPSLFEFKVDIGNYIGQVTAMTAGLAFYEQQRFVNALTYFDTAITDLDDTLGTDMIRVIHFFRGSTLLALGRSADAVIELQKIVPDLSQPARLSLDGLDLDAANNYIAASIDVGHYETAETYLKMMRLANEIAKSSFITATILNQQAYINIMQGEFKVAKENYERALGYVDESNPDLRAMIIGNLGFLFYSQGNFDTAQEYLLKAQQVGVSKGSADILGLVYTNLGVIAYKRSDYSGAQQFYKQALSHYEKIGDEDGIAGAYGNLALVATHLDDYQTAQNYYAIALNMEKDNGSPLGQAKVLGNLAVLAARQGNYAQSAKYSKDALSIYRNIGNPDGVAKQLVNLAQNERVMGHAEQAMQLYQEALDLFNEIGNQEGQANALAGLGAVAGQQSDFEKATSYFEAALKLYNELDIPDGRAETTENLGSIAANSGNYTLAIQYFNEALSLYKQIENISGQASVIDNLGSLSTMQGDYAGAEHYFQEALELNTRHGYLTQQAQNLGNLGTLFYQEKRFDRALHHLLQSKEAYSKLGIPMPPQYTEILNYLQDTADKK